MRGAPVSSRRLADIAGKSVMDAPDDRLDSDELKNGRPPSPMLVFPDRVRRSRLQIWVRAARFPDLPRPWPDVWLRGSPSWETGRVSRGPMRQIGKPRFLLPLAIPSSLVGGTDATVLRLRDPLERPDTGMRIWPETRSGKSGRDFGCGKAAALPGGGLIAVTRG